jgi:hypothetical protein
MPATGLNRSSFLVDEGDELVSCPGKPTQQLVVAEELLFNASSRDSSRGRIH